MSGTAAHNADDARWLTAAAHLGLRGRPFSAPNPAVGAIVIKDGRVIGRGWTQPGGRPHGEAMALAEAGTHARGATLYTALEPCAHPSLRGPTCSRLIADAGIGRVVYGVTDPDPRTAGEGARSLEDAGVQVTRLDSPTCHAGLKGYLTLANAGRPHVTLKLAMSLDGFIARPDGESRWITGDAARSHVHSRRAMADAILVGGGTWRKDDPRLDVRLPGLENSSPRPIILSRSEIGGGVRTIHAPADITTLDAVQYLYVEGGAQTAAAFLRADLVDRIDLYRAPILLGCGISALADVGLTRLDDAHGRWRCTESRMLGSDHYAAYDRNRPIPAQEFACSPE